MKPAQIAAERLTEWLEGHESVLIPIIGNGGGLFKVTHPQWQAERDRMKAMEAPKDARTTPEMIAAWKAAQGKAMPIEQIPEPTYEQQLWDRVASSAIGGIVASSAFHNYQNFQGNVANAVDFASQIADAFMAERAKRVGK